MGELKVRQRAEVGLDGGGPSWWYVCEACHGIVNYMKDICPHCDAVLSWESFRQPNNKKIFRGEHTEPAE